MDSFSLGISLPISFQEQVTGMLIIGDKVNRRDFSTQDVDFLQALMQRVAYVVDHHRLYEELKHNYKELDQAYEQLKDVDRFKSDIITITNHELRGPLTLIKGYLDLLNARLESFDDRKRHELLALAKKGADRLAQIVADLRVVTDIETGRIHIDPGELNLHELALEAEASLGAEPLVRFDYDFAQNLPSAYGDREKVAVLLHNLMDNASKFAGKYGPINVGAYAEEDGVVLFVKDQGPGMRKEYLDSIFGLFSLIGDSDHHSEEGLGLGLYIARRLVEMHGGRIWGESEIDQGSSFFVFLPTRPVTQPDSQMLAHRRPDNQLPADQLPRPDGETILLNLQQDGYMGSPG
jgi:signal transduction histidine kinase